MAHRFLLDFSIFTGGIKTDLHFELRLCSLLALFGRFQVSSPLVRIWSNAFTRSRGVQTFLCRRAVSRFLAIFEGGFRSLRLLLRLRLLLHRVQRPLILRTTKFHWRNKEAHRRYGSRLVSLSSKEDCFGKACAPI